MNSLERISIYALNGSELDTITVIKNTYHFTEPRAVQRLVNACDWDVQPYKVVFPDGSVVLL